MEMDVVLLIKDINFLLNSVLKGFKLKGNI